MINDQLSAIYRCIWAKNDYKYSKAESAVKSIKNSYICPRFEEGAEIRSLFSFFELKASMVNKIKELLEIRFQEEDMQDCFTIDVQLEKSKKLQVYVDSDEGITFQKCSRISRFLEAEIEENKWLPENYRIDVSSPGAEKPMVHKRQYKKHVGRELMVHRGEDDVVEGELIKVEAEYIEMRNNQNEEIKIEFDQIVGSSVKLKFK